MSYKIILVFPAFWNDSTSKPDRPPLGVLTVAAPLVSLGMTPIILDERIEPDFDNVLREHLKDNPLCVGISSMSGRHIKMALRISKLVKDNSDVPVVWGGVQASLDPESTIRHPLVDIIIRDDGEEVFPKLLDELYSGKKDLRKIPGIAYKENKKIIYTDEPVPADIEKIPLIPFHLLDLKKYGAERFSRDAIWTKLPGQIIPMETSRGCPFSCIFCTESVRKKKWRALPAERVIRDIKSYIDKYNITNFTFIDDNLFGNIKRGERVVELLIEEDLGINWYTNIRTDYISKADKSFIDKLEKSGCRMLTFGAESGSDRILGMINKKASVEQLLKTHENLLSSRIYAHYVAIRGFPTETKEDITKTFMLLIRLLLENSKAICDTPALIPTPSTKISEMCLGDLTNGYELEDWADIFDLFNDQKPPWLLDETYEFIKSHNSFPFLVGKTNTIPPLMNFFLRSILRAYKFCLIHGGSKHFDKILMIFKNLFCSIRSIVKGSH